MTANAELELADWRRRVSGLYAAVRSEMDAPTAHARWRAGRDELFRNHPQSPLAADHPFHVTGIPYWDYDASLRFELQLLPPIASVPVLLSTGQEGVTTLLPVGRVELPDPLNASVDVWWLNQYAGGLFLPVRDGSAGSTSYGGGRYLLDTAKGADLGGSSDHLIVDLNFLYHPSCRYDSAWTCPLAPASNTISAPISAGERL